MKEVFVYLEGPSDQLGIEKLLANAIETPSIPETIVLRYEDSFF